MKATQRPAASVFGIRLISLMTGLLSMCFQTLSQESSKILYAGNPNHREIAVRAFRLALQAGFLDSSLDTADIRNRMEAGAYSEDYEPIPGVVGSHFPNPWDQGPEFACQPLPSFPIQRIPYGSLADPLRHSGWYRGLAHGFDPVNNYKWPDAEFTTIEWANANETINTFSWSHAISLYQQGSKLEAYQCLGHVLHLLMDLSVPAHVNVVNHGASLVSSGYLDFAQTIVDEYETALSGGLNIPPTPFTPPIEIPDLSGVFTNALGSALVADIPDSTSWDGYFRGLAISTYHDSLVNRYYAPPDANGHFGSYKDSNGQSVQPSRYGRCTAAIDGRETVMSLLGTAHPSPLISTADMTALCNRLVPKAVEYCAGLILLFHQVISGVQSGAATTPCLYSLDQNYPNPFNPSTTITYQLPTQSRVTLRVFDLLGREVVTLVDGVERQGYKSVRFDASGLASGVYFCRLAASGSVLTRRMLLMK